MNERMPQRPLRVLFLAPQPFFEVRGTPLAVRAFVTALTRIGHQVDLLSYPAGEDVAIPGLRQLRSLRLPVGRVRPGPSLGKLALDVPFMLEAWARMAFGRYHVVHAVEEAAHLAAPLARLLRRPLVVDVDSSIPDQLRESGFARRGPLPWLAGRLERHALRHAAAAITVCSSLTEAVRARAPDTPVFQVEDPPLLDVLPSGPQEELRRELGLDAAPVVLYSGNFEPYQGVELLAEAAGSLSGAQVVFMGGEPGEIDALRALSARFGGRCVFSGKRPPAELGAFLALADVLVSPRCKGVNTPFKLYSYLASGKPLVATRIRSHTQLLDDELALLVEPRADALAAGIRAVLADAGAARARARRGQELVQREYSATRHAQKVADAYAYVTRRLVRRAH